MSAAQTPALKEHTMAYLAAFSLCMAEILYLVHSNTKQLKKK